MFPVQLLAIVAIFGLGIATAPYDTQPRGPSEQRGSLLDSTRYAPTDIIQRDVAVIGGGSAGTYTAVQLHDRSKSVVVVDRKARLGGHAETYMDPKTGAPVDIGVVVFPNVTVVKDYLARLKIELVKATSSQANTSYVNFDTGKTVDFQPPSQSAEAIAFKTYAEQIAKYPTLQASFNMTYPVAKDLLLPFGEFVDKYKLDAMMYRVFLTNQGYAPLLNLSTIYMLKYLNDYELREFKDGFLTTKKHSSAAIYDAASEVLGGSNLLLNSEVLAMDRSKSPVRIAVSTPSGRKLVVARKLVSAVPPIVGNLKGYDLRRDEEELFSQFFANGYYTGLLRDTGLATPTMSYDNVDKSRPYDIPARPGIYAISVDPSTNLTHVYSASVRPQKDEDVKKQIEADINRARRQRGLPHSQVEWATFSNHAPFNLQVSPQAIADGFYQELYGLNGQQHTFWTGAAFQTQDSSKIWQLNKEYILPILLGSLDG